MKIPWYVILLTGFVAGLLVQFRSCDDLTPKVITKTDTVTVVRVDTVILPPTTVIIKEPVIQRPYDPTEQDPPLFELNRLRTYVDTVTFDGLKLGYNIETRGTLQRATFYPAVFAKSYITTINKTEKIEGKVNGLYIGLQVGGSQHEFSNLSPAIDYLNKNNIFGYSYNLIDRSHNVRISRRVF